MGSRTSHLTLALVLIALSPACNKPGEKRKDPVIGRAWTGPVKLNLRSEVNPQSKIAVATKHGDRLDVVQIRRRFVRVRTEDGTEGWTEMRNLLGADQMEALQRQAEIAKKMPSQGEATVYEPLNVHTEPLRLSTSFYQILPGMKVDVVAHRLVERSNTPPPPAIQIAKPVPVRKKKKKKEPAVPPPPKPRAPGLPKNWRELSRSNLPPPPPESEASTRKKAAEAPKPVLEDWSLVRTKDGRAGWVLTRAIVMAIPDEVAQYSEGARIMAYFPLADVDDEGQKKHHWLWVTVREGGKPYQFDGFRVFIYMLRRHRYETAYIERGIEGYYPVEVERGATPKFSMILRSPEGQLLRKTWVLEGYNVRKVGESVYKMPKDELARVAPSSKGGASPSDSDDDDDDDDESLIDRVKKLFKR